MIGLFVAVIPAKAGIQCFFWIPGRVSLARNDDPTPGTVNPVLDTGPPAEPGVYLNANYFLRRSIIHEDLPQEMS